MKTAAAMLSFLVTAALLAGCGSGAKPAAHRSTTLAGVGVTTTGPPPKPSTPVACARRWNGSTNSTGRAAAVRRAPQANTALVRTSGAQGYFGDLAGRCLVYVVTGSKRAAVFVETARGRFRFVADGSGLFSANAVLAPNGRLQFR
jgi:hypothetical protein